MDHDEYRSPTFSLARRWGAGLNLIVTVAALLALLAMTNYLAIRHYKRAFWTSDAPGQLSNRTRNVLATLTNDVKIIAYFKSDDDLFPHVRALLKEYQFASPHLAVQYVDYLRDGAQATLIAANYKLAGEISGKNLLIVDSPGRAYKIINAADLSDYDYSELVTGKSQNVYRTHFKGELLLTSAIYSVSSLRSPKAYFVYNHNEHLPGDTDSARGYSKFAQMLNNENNFQVDTLDLTGKKEVPADCNLLIIAGPQTIVPESELEAIQRYLEQGGRLLVAFHVQTIVRHNATGLEKLLARWGVDVGENVILDPEHSSNGNGMDPMPVQPGSHPTVNSLGNARVQMVMPRSIHAKPGGTRRDETKVDELLFTGKNSVAITDVRRMLPKAAPSQPLMVAVEKSIPSLERGSTRIVAIGDSTLWVNQLIESGANRDLASSVVNWLVSQGLLLGDIPRQAVKHYRLTMTSWQEIRLRWLLLAGLPGLVLVVGTVVWLRRRN